MSKDKDITIDPVEGITQTQTNNEFFTLVIRLILPTLKHCVDAILPQLH